MHKFMSKSPRGDNPVVESRRQDDIYKISVLRYAHERNLWNVPAVSALVLRSPQYRFQDYIDEVELRENLEHASKLSYDENMLRYLRQYSAYDDQGFMARFENPARAEVEVLPTEDGQYSVRVYGPFGGVSPMEIPGLSIVTTLFSEGYVRKHDLKWSDVIAASHRRIDENLALINANPDLRILLFGKRRALAPWMEHDANHRYRTGAPGQIIAFSGIDDAMDHSETARGTNPHEIPMLEKCMSDGTDQGIVGSYNLYLDTWEALMGPHDKNNLTFLPDLYTTEAFMRLFLTDERAINWLRFREDSAPGLKGMILWGERLINRLMDVYNRTGDERAHPKNKTLIFSNGLTVTDMDTLTDYFKGLINVAHGWGTNATNDTDGLIPRSSMAWKLVEANGQVPWKISDNLAKKMVPEREWPQAQRVFGPFNLSYEGQEV